MARDGMANLISQVRNLAQVGTADYTVGATTYWNDDQLQAELDKTQVRKYTQPLDYIDDSLNSYKYRAEFIERAGTNSGFAVIDSNGSAISTALYSVNYDAKIIEFSANTYGTAYFVNYRQYDLYKAVSEVWGAKAGYYSDMVSWASDNHRVELGKMFENALNMASKYDEMSSPIKFVRRFRTDEVIHD